MAKCKFNDCGWCYAPSTLITNALNGSCREPEQCVNNTGGSMTQLSISILRNMTNTELLHHVENSLFAFDNISIVLAERLGQEMIKSEQAHADIVVNSEFALEAITSAKNLITSYDELVKELAK